MEIYTTDLITLAQECAERITSNVGYTGYFIEDECCNLQHDIRKKIYDRLTIAFNDIVERSCAENFDLKRELFKTINEL